MKLGLFSDPEERKTFPGIVDGDRVTLVSSWDDLRPLSVKPLASLSVLAPSLPSKIVGIGLNYRFHAKEMGMAIPDEPVMFLKPPSAVLRPGGEIVLPPESSRVDYEAELGVVIGRECRNISESDAGKYILGYTAFNDVTARDLQKKDGQWNRAKGFDTFAPFGPWIETDFRDPDDVRVRAILNGKTVQDCGTSDMIFNVGFLVAWASRVMTLLPGDVIATGTPHGIGPMRGGDRITVRIEGLSDLENTVR